MERYPFGVIEELRAAAICGSAGGRYVHWSRESLGLQHSTLCTPSSQQNSLIAFFLSAIGFLFPSFRWSVGMQLCDQRCKLYSVHMSSVACVQQASEGNRWLENVIYKMWSVWTQTLHSENGYESWSLEGKIKGPSFLAYGRECALSFKELWGILSAPTCNCILLFLSIQPCNNCLKVLVSLLTSLKPIGIPCQHNSSTE